MPFVMILSTRTEADTAQKIEPQEPLEELDESPRRANGHLPGPENVEVFEVRKVI